jgi:cytidylate kinase
MSGLSLNSTIEKRLETLVELGRRNQILTQVDQAGLRPSITISREFGCEGFAVAQVTQSLLQARTGAAWGLMDRGIMDKVAGERSEAMDVLRKLGEKNGFLDEMMSTILTNWNSDKDYYRLLCSQISLFAKGGHVVFVGLGATILTQTLPNCYQFRIVAPMEFRIDSIARRHNMSRDDAYRYIQKNQKQRVGFINEFLNRDVADPTLYHMTFSREKNSVEQIAEMICKRVLDDMGRKRESR